MKKISLMAVLVLTVIFGSCEKEPLEADQSQSITQSKALNEGIEIRNGRLYFQSKESFQEIYKTYADASEKELKSLFQPLYESGFYSLRPIVDENNEEFLYEHYSTKLKKEAPELLLGEETFDYLDYTEAIIGDDAFAAFLDFNSEIQIADNILKYTDVGLFIINEEKYADLQQYLDKSSISQNMIVQTDIRVKEEIHNRFPRGGEQSTDNGITYFRIQPIDPEFGSGGGGGYTPTPGSPASSDPSYNAFLNNLGYCSPHSGLFGNLFGDNNVCIDKYEKRRRVKTKAFNYNYLIVYHLGVKCKHQYRGWTRFWRTEATDEIRLVVEAAQFQYDLDALLGNNAVNNQTKERIYFMNNQKVLYQPNALTLPNWGTPSITYSNMNALPAIFKDDLSFEFFSTGWDWLDNQIQDGIDSNLKASKLNQYFYNGLYDTAKSQLQTAFGSSTNPPANRTFVAKFPQNGKMIFQRSHVNKGYNIGIRQKTFDWGAEFGINASASGSDGWRISGGQGSVLVRPENFRVKIIGAARRGSGWHGSKFNVGIN